MKVLDSLTSIMWLDYDPTNKVVYITNKGSSTMQNYYLNESAAAPELVPLLKFKRTETLTQVFFLPKICLDCDENEIAKTIHHCGKTI